MKYNLKRISQGSVSMNTANYITASCILLARYKVEMLKTNTFNHRLEKILFDAESIGYVEQVMHFLEKIL